MDITQRATYARQAAKQIHLSKLYHRGSNLRWIDKLADFQYHSQHMPLPLIGSKGEP